MASEGDTGPGGTLREQQLHTPLPPPPGSGAFLQLYTFIRPNNRVLGLGLGLALASFSFSLLMSSEFCRAPRRPRVKVGFGAPFLSVFGRGVVVGVSRCSQPTKNNRPGRACEIRLAFTGLLRVKVSSQAWHLAIDRRWFGWFGCVFRLARVLLQYATSWWPLSSCS